jgi:hypothetical protein
MRRRLHTRTHSLHRRSRWQTSMNHLSFSARMRCRLRSDGCSWRDPPRTRTAGFATGHCFAGDYSASFRPDSDDRTECPDCGAFGSHTHILDTCPDLRGARAEWLRNHSSYSIFSCEETGSYLVEFLYHTQQGTTVLERLADPDSTQLHTRICIVDSHRRTIENRAEPRILVFRA